MIVYVPADVGLKVKFTSAVTALAEVSVIDTNETAQKLLFSGLAGVPVVVVPRKVGRYRSSALGGPQSPQQL
jgi:hypothetical protein